MVTTYTAEGWCTDPFGRHEARWISAGRPTSLVRDSGVESSDPVPDGMPDREATPIPWGERPTNGKDLLRSDQSCTTSRQEMGNAANAILTRTHD